MAVSVSSSKTPAWMMTGKKAQEAMVRADADAKDRKEASDRMRRFWLNVDEEARVTFLDGHLNDKGVLQVPVFLEHMIQVAGRWRNITCVDGVEEGEPCPLCTSGNRSSLVGMLTVMNHTPYVIMSGPNKGKTLLDRRMLFLPSHKAVKKLMHVAVKCGGLKGNLFTVNRTGEREPRVGDIFEWEGEVDWDDFTEQFKEEIHPADYTAEIPFVSASELKKMGLGGTSEVIGGDTSPADNVEDKL